MMLHLASFVYVHVRVFRFSVTVQSLEFRTAARHDARESGDAARARSAQTYTHRVTTSRHRSPAAAPLAARCVVCDVRSEIVNGRLKPVNRERYQKKNAPKHAALDAIPTVDRDTAHLMARGHAYRGPLSAGRACG